MVKTVKKSTKKNGNGTSSPNDKTAVNIKSVSENKIVKTRTRSRQSSVEVSRADLETLTQSDLTSDSNLVPQNKNMSTKNEKITKRKKIETAELQNSIENTELQEQTKDIKQNTKTKRSSVRKNSSELKSGKIKDSDLKFAKNTKEIDGVSDFKNNDSDVSEPKTAKTDNEERKNKAKSSKIQESSLVNVKSKKQSKSKSTVKPKNVKLTADTETPVLTETSNKSGKLTKSKNTVKCKTVSAKADNKTSNKSGKKTKNIRNSESQNVAMETIECKTKSIDIDNEKANTSVNSKTDSKTKIENISNLSANICHSDSDSSDSDFEDVEEKIVDESGVKIETPDIPLDSEFRKKTKGKIQTTTSSKTEIVSTSKNSNPLKRSSLDAVENHKSSKCSKQTTEKTKAVKAKKQSKSKPLIKSTEEKITPVKDVLSGVDESDVTSVLLRMEGIMAGPSTSGQGHSGSAPHSTDSSFSIASDDDEDDDDDEDEDGGNSDWEEVEDYEGSFGNSQIPDGPVEITLDHPNIMKKKRQKKKFDWIAFVEKKIRKFKKDVRISMHKVELLCLLSHGIRQNKICDMLSLRGQAMSLVPVYLLSQNLQTVDLDGIKSIIKWFHGLINFTDTVRNTPTMISCDMLEESFDKKEVNNSKQLVLMFVIIMRMLGFDVRLIMSFHPLPLKPPSDSDATTKQKSRSARNKDTKAPDGKSSKLAPTKNVNKKPEKEPKAVKKQIKDKNSKVVKSKYFDDDAGKNKSKYFDDGAEKNKKSSKSDNLKSKSSGSGRKKRRVSNSKKNYSEDHFDVESGSDYNQSDVSVDYSDEDTNTRKRKVSGKGKVSKSSTKRTKVKKEDNLSDFEEKKKVYRSPVNNNNKQTNKKTTSEHTNYCDVWVEIFLPEECMWICVDCITGVINKPYEIESMATSPLHYCLAYSSDGYIKDVTARYASQWFSSTRKLRVDSDWWRETLEVYRNNEDTNEADDENIKDQLINRPMPTSIGQLKNHPLYVLTRHLLKFEAIYPDSAVPVGYIRSEPIYARECVHTLHSRENWMKEGRCVNAGEEPYKMVKSRPKWNKPKENPDALDLECFGEWQTEIYLPPPAVDGKVPRNVYGNVELFKPWMLPPGTVHIQVPALNRVAKKLGIDCVAAMTGWDTHGGFSHAVLDGWIVCEEHQEALMAAWQEDQEIQRQRELEKIEKRVLDNWRLLIRGLLIKQRLQKKFLLQEEIEVEKKEEKKKSKKGEKAKDAELSWPRRQQAANSKQDKNSGHFDVETL